MAKLNINTGASDNDKSGDTLRTAFTKINANFTELYATASADVQIPDQGSNSGKYLTTNGTALSWGTISTTTNQLVNGDFNFILGPDGTVNFDPSGANGKGILQTTADLQFTAVDKTWTFGTDGTLTLPFGAVYTSPTNSFIGLYADNLNHYGIEMVSEGSSAYTEIRSGKNISLYANLSDSNNVRHWVLGTDGNLTIPNNGTIADSNSYLTTLNLYVQGSLKGVDGSTGTTGQILTRQSNGGVAWANLAALPYVKSTFTGGTATLDIFTATWVNSVAIRLQISVSNTVNVTLQYTATSIIAGTTTSTNGGGMWTQPPNNPPFSSTNLNNLGDVQVMYLQDITNQKIYRITGMNTAGNVNPAQGSVLIERII